MENQTSSTIPHKRLQTILSIIGLLGIMIIFLPFAGHYSIWSSSFNKYSWFYAFPGLFTVAVSAASFRWLLSGRFSLFEKIMAYLAGFIMFLCTIYLLAFKTSIPKGSFEWIILIIPIIIYGFGIYTYFKLKKDEYKIVLILQIPPLAHYFFCSVIFFPFTGSAVLIGFIPALAYLMQIIIQLKSLKKT